MIIYGIILYILLAFIILAYIQDRGNEDPKEKIQETVIANKKKPTPEELIAKFESDQYQEFKGKLAQY